MSMESPTRAHSEPTVEAEQLVLPEVAREHIQKLFYNDSDPRSERELRRAFQRVLGHLQNNLGVLDQIVREVVNPNLEKLNTYIDAYSQAKMKNDTDALKRLEPKLEEVQSQFLKELSATIGYSPDDIVAAVSANAAMDHGTRQWNEMVAKERATTGEHIPADGTAKPAEGVPTRAGGDPQTTSFAEEEYQAISAHFYDDRYGEEERAHHKSLAVRRAVSEGVPDAAAAAEGSAAAVVATEVREALEANPPAVAAEQAGTPEATEKTLAALQAQADRLITLTRHRREDAGLSHAAAKAETDSYAAVRSEISKIKNRLRAIEKGADEATKRAEISALRSELASHLWALRSELASVPAAASEAADVPPPAEKKTGWWDKAFQAAHNVIVSGDESAPESSSVQPSEERAATVPAPEAEVTIASVTETVVQDGEVLREASEPARLLGLTFPPPDAAPFGFRAFRDALKIEWQPILQTAAAHPESEPVGRLKEDVQYILTSLESVPDSGLSESVYADLSARIRALNAPNRIASAGTGAAAVDAPASESAPVAPETVTAAEAFTDLPQAIDALLTRLKTATPRNTFIDGGTPQSAEVTLELASLRASLKDLRSRIAEQETLSKAEQDALETEFADLSYRASKLMATAERIRPMHFYGIELPVAGPEGIAAARALQAKLVEVRTRAEGQGDERAVALLREMWSHIALIPEGGLSAEQVAKLRNLAPKVPESFRSPIEGVVAARSRSLPELPGLKSMEGSEQKDKAGRRRLGFFGAAIVGGVLAALVADRQLDTDVRTTPPSGPVAEGGVENQPEPAVAPAGASDAGPQIKLVDSYWPTASADASADDLFPEATEAAPKLETEYRFEGERNAAGEVIDTVSEAAFEFWKQHPEVVAGPTLTKNEFLKALYSVLDYAEKHPREKAALIDAMGLVSGDFDTVERYDGTNDAASTVDLAPLFAKISAEVS